MPTTELRDASKLTREEAQQLRAALEAAREPPAPSDPEIEGEWRARLAELGSRRREIRAAAHAEQDPAGKHQLLDADQYLGARVRAIRAAGPAGMAATLKAEREERDEQERRIGQVFRALKTASARLKNSEKQTSEAGLLALHPNALATIPLEHFGVETPFIEPPAQGPASVDLNELRHRLRQLEDAPGRPRERSEKQRRLLIELGLLRPRLAGYERVALLWLRTLVLSGSTAEEALTVVARMTSRKLETVQRYVARFFSSLGVDPPLPLPQRR